MSVEIEYKEPESRPIKKAKASAIGGTISVRPETGPKFIYFGQKDDGHGISMVLADARDLANAILRMVEQQEARA